MLRTESLRSCSNWTLTMRSSYQVACIPTCSRMPTFGGHTVSKHRAARNKLFTANPRCRSNAWPHPRYTRDWRRPRRDVLRALASQLRALPYHHRKEGLLGRPNETARENAKAFARHIRQVSIETWLDARPYRLQRGPEGGFQLHITVPGTQAPGVLSAAAMVIATGTRFEGEDWLGRVENARRMAEEGRVHVGAPWAGDPNSNPGGHVAVIGGGDNAFDVSRMLAERGVRVTIVMRGKSARALPLMVQRLRRYESSGMVRVISDRTVQALQYSHSRICVRLNAGEQIEVDDVVILFGYRPNADEHWIAGVALEGGAGGYLVVGVNSGTRGCV